MKAKTIDSKVTVSGAVMSYALNDKETGKTESFSIDLAAIFPGYSDMAEIAQRALAFATRTKVRNGTGGKTLADAAKVVAATLDQLTSGAWVSASRQSAGESRVSIFIRALAQAMGKDPKEALEIFNAKVDEVCRANGIDPEAEDEESSKAASKAANAVRAKFREIPKVNAAYLTIKLAEDQAKAEKASAAADAAGDGAIILGAVSLAPAAE